MGLIREVIAIMDSELAGEFVRRYRTLKSMKGREAFDKQKERLLKEMGTDFDATLKRDIRITPMKTSKRHKQTEGDINVGPFSLRVIESKTVEMDWDHLDWLLYHLDEKGILDTVMKPFEAPERIAKGTLYRNVAKPSLTFFKEKIFHPVIDTIGLPQCVEEIFDIFVERSLKDKLLLSGGDEYYEQEDNDVGD